MSESTKLNETTTQGRPWVERYRPKSLDDVSHQNEVVATLKNAVATGRLPHLLLYGPPGSGKVRYGFLLDSFSTCWVYLFLIFSLMFH